MAILNDYGDAGVARIERILQHFAGQLGVDKEYAYAFFNGNGRLPSSLGEFQAYLNDASNNPYGWARRDPATGALRGYLHPGDTPGTRGAADPGFRHVITNAEDTAVQRFKDFDPAIFDYERGMTAPAPTAFHPNRSAQGTATTGQGSVAQTASVNPYPVGSPYHDTWEQGNPSGSPRNDAVPADPPTGAPPAGAGGGGGGAGGGGGSGLGPLVDAAAYGNTQTLQARIDEAIRAYAEARTTAEREAAYLDLQRWQTELKKATDAQSRYDAMAQAILSSAVQLQNNPRDWVKLNQYTSGGRDIVAQMQQAGPAFSGPTGPIEPGSVQDLMSRLGIQPGPATPATPAGVLPGAPQTGRTDLPAIPVPGAVGGPPGALQPGAGGAPAAGTTSLPAYEQMLAELDRAAGGHWGGDRANRQAVATNWWNADPNRRGRQMPAWS